MSTGDYRYVQPFANLGDDVGVYAHALGVDYGEAKRKIKAQRTARLGYEYGERIRRPDINHCRDCERAYEMGHHAPDGHPWKYEEDDEYILPHGEYDE